MKGFAIYWLIGCALNGLAIGSFWHKCPNDETTMVEIAAGVAAWPAMIFAVMAAPKVLPPTKCKPIKDSRGE